MKFLTSFIGQRPFLSYNQKPFFKVDKVDFSSSPKALKSPFCPNFLRRIQIYFFKKWPKKAVLSTFWKILTKKLHLLGASSTLKISIYWRHKRLLKNFRVRHQKWISQNSTKGDPLGRQGFESLRKSVNPPPYPQIRP